MLGRAVCRVRCRPSGLLRGYASAARGLTMPDIGLKPGDGINGFLSPEGVSIAWFQYHRMIVDRINMLLQTLPQFSPTTELSQLLTDTLSAPQEPQIRQLTALVSQAYMNEFFFRSLRRDGVNESNDTTLPEQLRASLENDFRSIDAIRDTALTRGGAIFGNGAVWLIIHGNYRRLVNTYSWGTPFSHAPVASLSSGNSSRYSTTASVLSDDPVTPVPLLCLNTWQHVYLHDYGVAGKDKYLANLWKTINWELVASRAEPRDFSP